ncbi:glycosyltransferase family 4 protein [Aeoliella mucimassa]|uniref:Putative glycosyl transferase n=1 Tax=Aeoliella mucimassa TaxID=2527972 RepID=A0A518AKW9_9BACT|nr:glycosyltransferase family 4 protein [Aeoliella mucimassa]QDU55351.1 putative glycosyl transferase [Aeoliella mucimassa]
MRAWLMHIGEQMPVDGPARKFRYGYVADALRNAGHHVTHWSPTFCHFRKEQRYQQDCQVEVDSNYCIQFVHAEGYRRNTSLARMRMYSVLGRRFHELAGDLPRPDLIVTAIPSLEWADAAVSFGRCHDIPVIVDVRDLWPDLYLNALPTALKPLGRLLLGSHLRLAKRACRNADALIAVSQSYLDWGLHHANRPSTARDQVVPLGYELATLPPTDDRGRLATLKKHGLAPDHITCLYAGQFETSYDVETIVSAARSLELSGNHHLQFALCGDGSKMAQIRKIAEGLKSVHLFGWVPPKTLQELASVSHIGLATYAVGAKQSLPNKAFEYMANRLCILSSLKGELPELLTENECGSSYQAGNAESLATAIRAFASNPEQLECYRQNAFHIWQNSYKSSAIYPRFVQYLNQFVAPRSQAA